MAVNYTAGEVVVTSPSTVGVITPGVAYFLAAVGTGAQHAQLELPPVCLSKDKPTQSTMQKVDFTLVDNANNSVKFSTLNAPIKSPNTGRVYLEASSNALAQSVTIRGEVKGIHSTTRLGYLHYKVTNNGSLALILKSAIFSLLGTHMCASRSHAQAATTGDSYFYDTVTNNIRLFNSNIANTRVGFGTNFGALGTTQHYQVTDAAINEVTQITGSGALADTISATATDQKQFYMAFGDASNTITIAPGDSKDFVLMFCVGVGANATAAATDSNNILTDAKANYTTHFADYDTIANTTHMTLNSPYANLNRAIDHILGEANLMGHFQKMLYNNRKFIPAGAIPDGNDFQYYTQFARDGFHGVVALCQAGATDVALDDYISQIYNAEHYPTTDLNRASQMHEFGDLLQTGGIQSSGGGQTPGDQEGWVILKFYEYFKATKDMTSLSAHLPDLNAIGNYLKDFYDNNANGKTPQGLPTSRADMSYQDSGWRSGPGLSGSAGDIKADPVVIGSRVGAIRALVELNNAAGDTSTANTFNTWLNTILAAIPANIWNSGSNWPYFIIDSNGTPRVDTDTSATITSRFGMASELLVFDALNDATKRGLMVDTLMNNFWNAGETGFLTVPINDKLNPSPGNTGGQGWHGPAWWVNVFKGYLSCFKFGTDAQLTTLWSRLKTTADKLLTQNYFRPGERASTKGLFSFSTGSLIDVIVKGLFGIEAHAEYFNVNCKLNKLPGPDQVGWQLNNFKMGGSTWTVTYTGSGQYISCRIDGQLVTGNINYPQAGTHTLSITASNTPITSSFIAPFPMKL